MPAELPGNKTVLVSLNVSEHGGQHGAASREFAEKLRGSSAELLGGAGRDLASGGGGTTRLSTSLTRLCAALHL